MRAAKTGTTLVLTFSLFESRLLQHILKQILANYQFKPEQLDAKSASAWYSTRGCPGAEMSDEETRDWLTTLHQYKSANVQHLANWLGRLSIPKAAEGQLRLKLQDASVLLTALNDHRLLTAARHDIGQEEMDIRTVSALSKLQPDQHTALCEIQFLSGIIEEILWHLPGSPGNWGEGLRPQ